MQEVPFEISLRKTTLRDLDGTVHHIPSGDKKSIKSFQRFFRINLDVGVGYSSNLEHVITVINKVGNEIANDPLWKDNIILAPQFLRVNDFADSSIMLKNIRRNITK
jgi:small conductance mechanosensitive channel